MPGGSTFAQDKWSAAHRGADGSRGDITAPATDAAKQWDGWGTAMKPAHEPIVMARKPLIGTVAKNVTEFGTGAINVDGCRIPAEKPTGWGGKAAGGNTWNETNCGLAKDGVPTLSSGRWPPNLLLTHGAECTETECDDGCPVAEMGRQSGVSKRTASKRCTSRDADGKCQGHSNAGRSTSGETFHGPEQLFPADTGTAARYFPCFRYQAKASKRERNAGTEDGNPHPTVKPIELMRWLCRLVTPPGGLVLDPFTGSGSTGCAAALEGFRFLGFEQDPEHAETARQRIAHHASSEGNQLNIQAAQ